MGLNTTVVILNDAVGDIERDPEFGAKLANAIHNFDGTRKTVSAGCHGNAACVIEMHHADDYVVVRVGGNTATVLPESALKKLPTAKRGKRYE
jgi:hypothetical protein